MKDEGGRVVGGGWRRGRLGVGAWVRGDGGEVGGGVGWLMGVEKGGGCCCFWGGGDMLGGSMRAIRMDG